MIKLLWNTHNQTKLPIHSRQDEINYAWGIYHKENSNLWIYEILKKVQYIIINDKKDIKNDDTLIIVDSSIENKVELYERLKLTCSKIFLFHLGDEAGIYDFSPIYNNCNYVLRTFCSNKYFENQLVRCVPIGYKSGIANQNIDKRKFKWAFIGTPHKSSRHDLLFQFSDIKESFCHKTVEFNKKIISVAQMNKILSATEFLPCPNGFVHPETYRLYEALECGCIPIVENAYKYYDRLFPDNPFIKVDKWIEAKSIIRDWGDAQIKQRQEECKIWWEKYKIEIQNFVKDKITL